MLADGPLIRIKRPTSRSAERRGGIERRHANLTRMNFNEAKKQAIAKFEQCYLAEALAKTHGNVTKAANLVGKERRVFGKLLKKHHMNKSVYSE